MQSLTVILINVYAIFVVPFAICKPTISIPTSCLSYLKDGVEKNGYYSIAFKNGETLTVYCDFTSEPGSAWTLVMSWAMENNNVPAFYTKALPEDAPVNDKTPNWTIYRLPKTKMAALKLQSTHWRSTCSFEHFGVDYKDYVRGKFKEFDISTFLGAGTCQKVEYINIRGILAIIQLFPFGSRKIHTYFIPTALSRNASIVGALVQFQARTTLATRESPIQSLDAHLGRMQQRNIGLVDICKLKTKLWDLC